MPRPGGKDLMVGTFATLAIVVLAVAVMTVGGESGLTRGVPFTVRFANTEGLRQGSPVKMAGVVIGSVRTIRLPEEEGVVGIDVRLQVDPDYAPRVRDDSRASLKYLQILSGEKYVEISPGAPDRPSLPAASRLLPSSEKEFFEQGADIAENINEITVSLKKILGPIEKGEGLLGQMVSDPEFGKEGLAAIRASMENLEVITARLRDGEGFAGRLLADDEFARRVDTISRSLESLASVLEGAGRREGAVGALLDPGGAGQRAIEDLRDAAGSLRRLTARLEAPEGLLGRLLHDTAYSDALASDLAATVRNLKDITGKINSGQGTLGALVNERVLHDGLEDVVAGTQDSKFARWLMRHYQRKGIEAQEAVDAPKESPE